MGLSECVFAPIIVSSHMHGWVQAIAVAGARTKSAPECRLGEGMLCYYCALYSLRLWFFILGGATTLTPGRARC